MAEQERERLAHLEGAYRPCACRSTTPFFGERLHKVEFASSHDNAEDNLPYRTRFQHDRDKVLYAPSFRRLRLKTQVFPEHTEDRLRTRLDHTLEVAQIGRHFARQLKLNEDLADAIGLAHDIGHTPFGHSGERALHRFLRGLVALQVPVHEDVLKRDGFKHNWQGLRQVDILEKAYPEAPGMNLTNAVRIGILKHTDLAWKKRDFREEEDRVRCSCDMAGALNFDPDSRSYDLFEVQLCTIADEIAQVIHDFEDDILSETDDVKSVVCNRKQWPFIEECLERIEARFADRCGTVGGADWEDLSKLDYTDRDIRALVLSRIRSQMIYDLTLHVKAIAEPKLSEWEREVCSGDSQRARVAAFDRAVEDHVRFPVLCDLGEHARFGQLQRKLLDQMVRSERVNRLDGKAEYVLRHILEVYLSRPRQVHDAVLKQFSIARGEHEGVQRIRRWSETKWDKVREDAGEFSKFVRAAVDYVAGMTDRFALREFDQLYSAYPRREL